MALSDVPPWTVVCDVCKTTHSSKKERAVDVAQEFAALGWRWAGRNVDLCPDCVRHVKEQG